MTGPEVSLVVETENDQEHRRIRLADTVLAWRNQTAKDRILEWIFVSKRPIRPEEKRLLVGLPYRWILAGADYYEQKNAGVALTRGRFISLADSDDRPEADWLERALEALDAAPQDVAAVTGRTRYDRGPFSREMTIAHFPFQAEVRTAVLTLGAGNSLFRGDVLRRLGFEGEHIRHGPDVDLACRMQREGLRVDYDPRLRMTHNYTDRLSDLWGHVAMKGHAFALFADFRKQGRRGALLDAVGRYRVLLARLLELRRAMEIPVWRFPVSCSFFVWYVVAAGYGYSQAQRGRPVPAFRI
jgi:hypothetical protein